VRASIDALVMKPHAGSALTAELQGYRSLKARRYRIVYQLNDDETMIEIYFVGHRQDAYETLRSLVRGQTIVAGQKRSRSLFSVK
jgi:mRNA-degrading endonuclease RelE of RelBE toxin-antitoxin system